MITLDLNTEGKRIKFTYAVANIDPTDITGKFVMFFGNSNVSFPIKVSNNNIVVELRSDNLFISTSVGKIIKSRLEIVAGRDTFIIPWTGQVKIEKSKIKEFDVQKSKPVYKEKFKEEVKKEGSSLLEQKIEKLRNNKKEVINKIRTKIGRKLTTEEEESVFKDFLNTPIDEIIYTKEELEDKKKEMDRFSSILNTPIDELIGKVKNKNGRYN